MEEWPTGSSSVESGSWEGGGGDENRREGRREKRRKEGREGG